MSTLPNICLVCADPIPKERRNFPTKTCSLDCSKTLSNRRKQEGRSSEYLKRRNRRKYLYLKYPHLRNRCKHDRVFMAKLDKEDKLAARERVKKWDEMRQKSYLNRKAERQKIDEMRSEKQKLIEQKREQKRKLKAAAPKKGTAEFNQYDYLKRREQKLGRKSLLNHLASQVLLAERTCVICSSPIPTDLRPAARKTCEGCSENLKENRRKQYYKNHHRPRPKKVYKKICPIDGTTFLATKRTDKFCSAKCREENRFTWHQNHNKKLYQSAAYRENKAAYLKEWQEKRRLGIQTKSVNDRLCISCNTALTGKSIRAMICGSKICKYKQHKLWLKERAEVEKPLMEGSTILSCETCGKPFVKGIYGRRRTCSTKCSIKLHRPRTDEQKEKRKTRELFRYTVATTMLDKLKPNKGESK